MSTLLKRYLAYLLIPAGLALLFLPLNTHRIEQADKTFLFLEINETLVAPSTPEPDVGLSVNEAPDEAMQALNEQLEEMQKLFAEEATITNTYGYPVLDAGDLTPYPALQQEVEDMMRMIALRHQEKSSIRRLDQFSIEQWNTFKNEVMGDSAAIKFQYGNRIFKGHTESDQILLDVEVDNLKFACKATGGVFLLLGFFALRGLYVPPSTGIKIGKRSGMMMWDVVAIGIGLLFTWVLLDSMLARYFHTVHLLGDEQRVVFMGVFWLLFASPVLALFTTVTGLQMLLITKQGVSVTGLFGKKTLSWSAVKTIRLAEFHSARQIDGFFAPRKLAKILEIVGESSVIRIMEPPFSSTKNEILDTLTAHAPEELKDSISDLSGHWLSTW